MDRDEILEKILMVVIVILVIVVGFLVVEGRKKDEQIKQVVSVSNKIIENIEYMELTIGDAEAREIRYKPAVAVFDESKLNVMEDMINTGEKYEFENPTGFDDIPMAYLYKDDGEIIVLSAIDNFEDDGENGNFIIYQTNKSEVKRIYKVEDEVGEFIENLYNERYDDEILLYYGYELQTSTGLQALMDMPLNDDMTERYMGKYNQYSKNKKLKQIEVKDYLETYEGYFVVEGNDYIAISEDYNPIPRQSKKLKRVPDKIKESLSKFDKVEVEEIDLNGDKELEYIAVGSTEDTSDDGKIMSKVVLYDKDYKTIGTLASWDATEDLKYLPEEVVLSLDDVVYFDINNDNKMEILMELPAYETFLVNIFRYDNNVLYGEKDYEVSLKP